MLLISRPSLTLGDDTITNSIQSPKCLNNLNVLFRKSGDTEQSRLESTTEITQNKHVKVLHYFVDDIK